MGAAGHHLIDYYNLNNQLFNTPGGTRFYPNLGNVNVEAARGNSIYNALQMEMQHRFKTGLQFTASYTFSRAIDNGGGAYGINNPQNILNLNQDRGLSDRDIRNRFVLSGVYELPFGKGRHFGAHIGAADDLVLGGWQVNTILTVQSGLPFNLTTPGSPGGRPDVVGPVHINPGNTYQYFNQNAFAEVPLNSDGVMLFPGTLGRNVLVGPGIRSVDLSLFKTFSITERVKFEFRAEAFNIANHPQYAQPNGDITNTSPTSGFGTITNYARERPKTAPW